jgi:hypothetical protein
MTKDQSTVCVTMPPLRIDSTSGSAYSEE